MSDPVKNYEKAVRLRTEFLSEHIHRSGSQKRRTTAQNKTADEVALERRARARQRADRRAESRYQ